MTRWKNGSLNKGIEKVLECDAQNRNEAAKSTHNLT